MGCSQVSEPLFDSILDQKGEPSVELQVGQSVIGFADIALAVEKG